MCIKPQPRPMPEDTGRIGAALLAADSPYRFIGELQDAASRFEAARNVRFRTDRQDALHLPRDYPGFDPSVLVEFCQRLRDHDAEPGSSSIAPYYAGAQALVAAGHPAYRQPRALHHGPQAHPRWQ